MASPSPRHAGTVLGGRYILERRLGSGSLGTVYLALDQQVPRQIALKIIRGDKLTPRAVVDVQREFQTFASLRHPQIAAAFDFGYLEGGRVPYYTREYVRGVPLPAGPPGGSSPGEFLRPFLDLLDALEYLHAAGMLHLDVHEGNLIVADDPGRGSVLIDFGIARSFHDELRSAYRHPERSLPPEILESGKLTPATDLFMAGRLLVYRLTGRGDGDPRLPVEIPGWGSRLTLELERIASKAMHPSLEHRFASARELRASLVRALGGRQAAESESVPADLTIGREPELRAIDESLRALHEVKSSYLCFKGPAGIGKSRMLREARLRAQLGGFEIVDVSFASGQGSTLRAAVSGLKSLPAADLGWLEPLSTEFGGTPEERSLRAAKAYFSTGGRPLVFLLDDLDRADRESRSLVDAMLEEGLHGPGAARARAVCVVAASAVQLPARFSRGRTRALKPLRRAEAALFLGTLSRPLRIAPAFLRAAVARSRGVPLRLRQIALALRAEWGPAGSVPESAAVPEFVEDREAFVLPAWVAESAEHRRLLEALAALGRPASSAEVAVAAVLPATRAASSLKKLAEAEVVSRHRRRREALYQLPAAMPRPSRGLPRPEVRRMHLRVAAYLGRSRAQDPLSVAHRARHLLLAGKIRGGRTLAVEVLPALRQGGHLGVALSLLEDALTLEKDLEGRLDLAELMSSIIEETGSHADGIALLEPFQGKLRRLSPRGRVRLWRMLGIHYHRGGFPQKALRVFELCRRTADPFRDRKDLIFVDSELAELYTYHASYSRAEEACRRGLDLLDASAHGDPFKLRMEIILRASLGHLELRRLHLDTSRRELKAALRLVRSQGMPGLEAVILNNLGIAERQLSLFKAARERFRGAERLLRRAGEGRSLVKIACNLAVIAAHEGHRAEAEREMDRAFDILRSYPGQRLEFFAQYTRGVVAHLLGDAPLAIEAMEDALPAGRALHDAHLVRFGEVLLAEAHLACGRLLKAQALLRGAARRADGMAPPILRRMIAARRLLISTLAGSGRSRGVALAVLEATPRTALELPEAWNDLYVSVAAIVAGEPLTASIDGAAATFQRTGVPAGKRLAGAVLLADAIRRGDRPFLESLEAQPTPAEDPAHRLLAVLEPLLVSEARYFLGDREGAEAAVSRATSAIVGYPYLELDWRIELMRGRLALDAGDLTAARRHIHRSLHARDLLAELAGRSSRDAFLRHPRFAELAKAAGRVEQLPRVVPSTRGMERRRPLEGMAGESLAFRRVLETVDRLRDQDLPVLIRGETGTGKDLLARALHRTSSRRSGPFLAVHCAALPDELFEAEVFGHEAGAFTGAEGARPGIVETLAGGTLLLDDVHHLTLRAQAKLLNVLGSGRARRLGSVAEYRTDVRFLASTSADLRAEVEKAAFRGDLYFRLAAIEIILPPLRERLDDLPLLARHLLERHAARMDRPVPVLGQDALDILAGHGWPGNVRELETVLLRALLSRSGRIGAADLRPFLPEGEREERVPEELMGGRTLKEFRRQMERAYVLRAFREARGDVRTLMSALGVKRTQLYALFRKLGIDPKALREGPRGD